MFDAETVRAILDGLRGVWEPGILAELADGPERSAQLRRRVSSDLDWRTYVDTTARLRDKGLITRTESREQNEVWYALTPAGRAVLELLADVGSWAETHRKDVPGLLPPVDPAQQDPHGP